MSTYVDSSVLLSYYLAEPASSRARVLIEDSRGRTAARITEIEVRRGIAKIVSAVERVTSRALFELDWQSTDVVELTAEASGLAATVAEETGLRTLDAIHVAAAMTAGCARFITFDVRQADAARAFGMEVVGIDG